MKYLYLTVLVFSFCRVSLAAPGEEFAKIKADFVQDLDSRMSALQTAKSCVSAAQDQAAMKICRDQMEKAHEQMRMGHMERRKERLDHQIQKLQEEKSKIEQKKQ